MRTVAVLVSVLALAGCTATSASDTPEPTESATPTAVALSADDDDRAMWQCITFQWGYDLYPTADEARTYCEWLRENNPDAYADYLAMYVERYYMVSEVPDPDDVGA